MMMGTQRSLQVYLTAVITIVVLFNAPAAADEDPPGLVRKDCFNWYTEGIQVHLWKAGEEKSVINFENLELKQNSTNSTNSKNSTVVCSKEVVDVKLFYEKGEGQTLDLDWSFSITEGGDWFLNENKSKIIISNSGEAIDSKCLYFKDTGIEAANQFSYSCSNLSVIMKDNSTPNVEYLIELKIRRFQVQPFSLPPEKKLVFADSFDCSTWFTIPLWVGLLVTLLFTSILATGVYALMGIKTPDRFENPKGKTITITTSE